MLSDAQIEKVVRLLDERFGLDALLVFGSEAIGTTHRESDVDLAALLQRRPNGLELVDAQVDLAAIAGRDVDLIDLANASPILAMQVVRTGRALFGADSPALAGFESRLASRYADVKRVRAEAESALLQRFRDDRS